MLPTRSVPPASSTQAGQHLRGVEEQGQQGVGHSFGANAGSVVPLATWPRTAPEPTTDRKLAALGVCGQTHEGDKLANNPDHPLYIYPITPAGCCCMLGEVGGEPISFLLDTGAAVTLIGSDVWRQINTKQPTKLQPWLDRRLVGVDGSPLEVHSQVHVAVVPQGKTLETEALRYSWPQFSQESPSNY